MVSVLAGYRDHPSASGFLVNLLFLVSPWLLGGLQPHVGLSVDSLNVFIRNITVGLTQRD